MGRRPVAYFASILLVVIILLSGVVAAGCNNPQPTPVPTSATTKPAPSVTPSPTVAPTSTPVAGQPKAGGVLKFWIAGTPGGYDSHRRPSYGPVMSLPVFSNLVRFDPTKSANNPSTVIGDLAQKWQWSADNKTCTFFLEKGVTWQDGVPFNADDVVYSVQKMLDPARSGIAANLAAIDKVEKVDDFTVTISLKAPSPGLLVQLAHGFCPIQSKHLANVDWKSTDFLVGTGPYKIKTVTSGVSYEFVKNPNYFRKGLPYLDGVLVSSIADRSASAQAVITGRLDMSSPVTGVANLEVYNMITSGNKNIVFQKTTGSTGNGYFFNVKAPGPLQDVRVRRAISLLMDPKQLVDTTYGSDMFMDPTTGVMPTAYALSRAEIATLLGTNLPFEQRVTQAQKLMADAGYAKGFDCSILSRNLAEQKTSSQLIADYLKRYLNINLTIVLKDSTEVLKARDAGQFDIVGDQPVSMLGEPNDLMPLFLGGSPVNFTGYSNPAVDKLWQEQATQLDMTKRVQITQQIEKALLTDLPFMPTAFFRNVTALQPYVKGFVASEGAYCSNIAWEQVWLDK